MWPRLSMSSIAEPGEALGALRIRALGNAGLPHIGTVREHRLSQATVICSHAN